MELLWERIGLMRRDSGWYGFHAHPKWLRLWHQLLDTVLL